MSFDIFVEAFFWDTLWDIGAKLPPLSKGDPDRPTLRWFVDFAKAEDLGRRGMAATEGFVRIPWTAPKGFLTPASIFHLIILAGERSIQRRELWLPFWATEAAFKGQVPTTYKDRLHLTLSGALRRSPLDLTKFYWQAALERYREYA